jgi:hypothetical protein
MLSKHYVGGDTGLVNATMAACPSREPGRRDQFVVEDGSFSVFLKVLALALSTGT